METDLEHSAGGQAEAAVTSGRPEVERTLRRLKDFQRRSVSHVFRRLYLDSDRVDRFLLADEVGLGKTLVARGTIARAVDHLWDSVDRIDIIYICSNSDIARQNISRLKLDGQEDFAFASRLTLLPLHTKDLEPNDRARRKLNLVSFTPGTSFDVGGGGGIKEERALLYCLLEELWALDGAGPRNVLQGGARTEGWREYLRWFRRERRRDIDQAIATGFVAEVEHTAGLRERFAELCRRFQRDRVNLPYEDRSARNELIGGLRRTLARCCIKKLRPDLVILDEFQRFRHLLHGGDDERTREVAELAKELFNYRGEQGERARVLLLSATPYKMYTLAHEADDDHYRDFLRTCEFLFGATPNVAEFERELRAYRAALCLGAQGSEAIPQLVEAKDAIERRLRKVMCRTERLAVSADRNGMLAEIPTPAAPILADDVHAFAWVDRVANALGAPDCVELWKSGAYLLNFMEDYDLKRKVRHALARNDASLCQALREPTASLFPSAGVQSYDLIDPGNARLRSLMGTSLDRGGWRLLWMPASLPYYAPGGVYAEPGLDGFTKTLVFSSWQLVPKVIAVVVSYEAERRMVRLGNPSVGYSELNERQRPLLRFAHDGMRLTGLPLLALLYPCVTLATEFDPLETGRRRQGGEPIMDANEMLAGASSLVQRLLEPVLATARAASGPPDERWYWAALLLMDRDRWPGVRRWLEAEDEWGWRWMADKDDTHFTQHVDLARKFFERPDKLGPPPDDLVEVLAKAAVASPAVVALRALRRRWPERPDAPPAGPETGVDDRQYVLIDSPVSPPLIAAAAWIAMGFQTLFNRAETILLLRGLNPTEPYWERVLDYAVDGNLQSVMDEYLHVLVESMGLEAAPKEASQDVAVVVHDAISLRSVALSHDQFVVADGGEASIRQHRMRCRYALRFGSDESEEGGDVTREDQVRTAFNSPFRPFILASTSVGQEGLDFHPYCHVLYHWNLPSNPVDLEQREGRIHRYKGHVIRKNLASKYGLWATAGSADPWGALFGHAATARGNAASDLTPYWVLDGPWKIERRVPLFHMSRETHQLEDLKRSLALYRLVFGQPRQEELVRLLRERAGSGQSPETLLRYQVDLSPPAESSTSNDTKISVVPLR